MLWTLRDLQHSDKPQACIEGQWVPARPENWKYRSLRVKLSEAWSVFSGKAEPFTWPLNQ